MTASGRHRTRGSVLVAISTVLIPFAVLIFATGFFPYKPFVPGLAVFQKLKYGDRDPPAPHFDKVVFMVVDALRSDFVYSSRSGFRFTQSLIRSGEAIPFTAHATSPTITMPRVKAITTGSIPSFLDVILNFAESDTTSTLANQDTWLAQIKNKKDGKLVMYGDDTWLKLFPDTFERSDGTSSFFVSDFTEVDNNVTRHVPGELLEDDWTAMIMHYLGLDHIGHKAGPQSPNMIPKQKEMDGIVEQVYEAMSNEPHLESTLLVLCGDHGMNDGGNHGGSAPGETSPALVFMSPKLKNISNGRPCPTTPRQDFDYYDKIEQSDIAPTLAGLLGFPVPLNNLGVFIPDFLPLWHDSTDQMQLLVRNSLQILDIVKATFSSETYEDISEPWDCEQTTSPGAELSCLWQSTETWLRTDEVSKVEADEAVQSLLKFCRRAQDIMSSTASNYDVSRLISGIGLAAVSFILVVLASWQLPILRQLDGVVFFLILVLYGAMMFASSYVEEEQHFWYWVTGGWIIYQGLSKAQKELSTSSPSSQASNSVLDYIMLLALHRITQRWNQTGQKFAGASDIVHDVLITHPGFMWFLVSMTYIVLLFNARNHVDKHLQAGPTAAAICSIILFVPAFMFKVGFTASDAPELLSILGEDGIAGFQQLPLVFTARLVFLTMISEAIWAFACRYRYKEERISRKDLITTLHTLLMLFLITQTRVTNIPLYCIFHSQDVILSYLRLTPSQITIFTLLLGYTSFFAMGNSNAISSVDLSNAYNGVSAYNVLAVGLLTFVSNWAGPIYWSVTGIKLLVFTNISEQNHASRDKKSLKTKRPWVSKELEHLDTPNLQKNVVPQKTEASLFFNHITLLTLLTSTSLLAVMVACTLLRTHLFIWTVFSPKYLYAMAWSLAFHFFISIGVGGALWWACGGKEENV